MWVATALGAILLLAAIAPARPNSDPASPPVDTPSETTITVQSGGRDVELAGPFDDGVAAQLVRILEANPGVARILLTSEGGYVDEAEAVGDIIAARGLVTIVSDYCVSACTLAFARGRERLLAKGGRLGFHAPSVSDASGQDVPVDSDAERLAYLAAGVAADFAEEALRVAPNEIWIPEPQRLIDARIVTALVERETPPPPPVEAERR